MRISRIWESLVSQAVPKTKDLFNQPLTSLFTQLQANCVELTPENIPDGENASCLCYSKEDEIIGGSSSGQKLIIWKNGIKHANYYCGSAVNTIVHGKVYHKVFAGTESGKIIRWAYRQKENSIHELNQHKKGVTSILLLEEDKMMISGGKDSKIFFWYLTARKKPIELGEHSGEIRGLKLSDDECKLFSCGSDGFVIVWNIELIDSIHVVHKLAADHGIEHIELNNNILLSADSKGVLVKWSLDDYSRVCSLEFPSKIVSMCKSNDNRYLYFILLSAIDFSINILTIDKMDCEKPFKIPSAHNNIINCVFIIPQSNKLITSSKDLTLKIWDFSEHYDESLILSRQDDINCMYVHESLDLIAIGNSDGRIQLYKDSGEKIKELVAVSKCQINCVIVTLDKKYIAAACEDQRVLLWRVGSTSNEPWHILGGMVGHSESVNNIYCSPDSRYLFSVSGDRSVKVWDLLYLTMEASLEASRNDNNGNSAEKVEVIGHKSEVTDVKATKNYIFSASNDGFVIVWSIKPRFKQLNKLEFGDKITTISPSETESCIAAGGKGKNIKVWWNVLKREEPKELRGHEKEILKIMVYGESNLLYSASKDSTVKIWSLDQKLILFSISFEHLNDLFVPFSQHYIYIVLLNFEKKVNTVKKIKNPLFSNTISVYPPEYAYFFKSYIKKIQYHESNIYDEYWQNYYVFPHSVNLSYVFIYSNRPALLKNCLSNGLTFLKNKKHESPLSWALQRNNTQCADVILKNLSKKILKDENVIIESIENEINKLIATNLSCLPFLFDNLFEFMTENIESTGKLKKTPMLAISSNRTLKQEEFLDKSKSKKKKEFLEYRTSLCRFNFELGSLSSLKLLNSITDCRNSELFRTQLLKAFLLYKWRQNFYILVCETIFYCIGLAIFTIYVITENRFKNHGLLIALLVLNCVGVFQNGTKAYHSFYKYIRNAWNILDLCRIALCIWYIINQLINDAENYSGLELLTLCYWLKAIGYFRIFNKYRYLLRVILEIIKDMIPFFLILFTSTIAFAMLLCVSQSNMQFYNAFVNVYLLDQTDFHFDLDSFENVLVFFLASLLNPIIMLNLLIAIMGDTYDRVQEDQIVADYREMTELILEAEYLIFWNRLKKPQFKYITRCDYMRNLNLEKNQWMGKIRAVKKSLQGLEGKFKASSKNIDIVQNNLIAKLNECISASSNLNNKLKKIKDDMGQA